MMKLFDTLKKKLAWLFLGSVALAAPLAFDTDEKINSTIDPITFNGQSISFPYTDDNANESLIIHTDRETYSSWDSTYVYFAVKNISSDDQSVKVQFAYEGGASTAAIEEYKPQTPYQVSVDDFAKTETCATVKDEVGKDVQSCELQKTGSHLETRYRDEWGTITKTSAEDLKSRDVKPIDSKFVAKEQVEYWIQSGQTKYFRAKITFTPKSNGEFFINAYGSLGAIGHLDPYYDSSWGYRLPFTVDASKIGTTTPITGFPVLFSTSTLDVLKATSSGGHVGHDDARDMLITESDGTTKLPHQVEKYSSSTGETWLWFKTSTSTPLSTSTNTTYYLYYGNSNASDQQDTSDGVNDVWDDNFQGVWHFGNGVTLSGNDATSNARTMRPASGITATSTFSQIDGAAEFNGASASYASTTATTLNTTPNILTLSAWIKVDNLAKRNTIFTTTVANTANHWGIEVGNQPAANRLTVIYPGVFMASASYTDTTAVHHIVYTRATSTSAGEFFIDGLPVSLASTGLLTAFSDDGGVKAIGNRVSVSQPYDGIIDEVRYSNVVRSNSWIYTEYQNQFSPNTFYSIGSEETPAPPPASSSSTPSMIQFE